METPLSEDWMVRVERDGQARYDAELKAYVDAQLAEIARHVNNLKLSGLQPLHIVFVSKNPAEFWGKNRRGVAFHTFEQFVEYLKDPIEKTAFPKGGYSLESVAVNGDDFDTMYELLQETWQEDPSSWERYKAERLEIQRKAVLTHDMGKLTISE